MEKSTEPKPAFALGRAAAGFIAQFSINPVRGAAISLKGLAKGEKLLALAGYAFCAFLLLLSLFLDAVSASAEPLKFPFTAAQSIHEMQPFAGMLALLGYVLAWTFIFTGAGRARKLAFYILLAVYFVFVMVATVFAQNLDALCIAPVVALVLPAVHLVGRRLKLFDRAPLLMFVIIGAVISVHAITAFFLADDADTFGLNIYTFFRYLNYLAYPLWMYSGISLIGFAMALASALANRAAGAADPAALKFAQLALAAHFAISVVIYVLRVAADPSLLGDVAPLISVAFSGLLLAAMFALKAGKKWSVRNALSLLALSLAFGIFVAIVNTLFKLGFNATDPINAALDKLGILPRGTFFMFTLMVGVLGSFVPFSEGDTPALPRPARVFIAVGFAILFIAMMFVFVFTVNTADGSNYTGDSIFTGLTVFGALLIGIPVTLVSLFGRRAPDAVDAPAASAPSGALKFLALAFPLVTWLLNRAILALAR